MIWCNLIQLLTRSNIFTLTTFLNFLNSSQATINCSCVWIANNFTSLLLLLLGDDGTFIVWALTLITSQIVLIGWYLRHLILLLSQLLATWHFCKNLVSACLPSHTVFNTYRLLSYCTQKSMTGISLVHGTLCCRYLWMDSGRNLWIKQKIPFSLQYIFSDRTNFLIAQPREFFIRLWQNCLQLTSHGTVTDHMVASNFIVKDNLRTTFGWSNGYRIIFHLY